MTTCAILLSAGESTRMGTPKGLLDWFGAPLAQRQAEALLEAGADEVYVVTGHRGDEVGAVLPDGRVKRVHNPDYAQGKTTSIKAGLAALPNDVDTIILLAVDQPRPAWLIRQVLQAHQESRAPVTSPRYRGRGGHPLIFDGALRDRLTSITEEKEGVREVMEEHREGMARVEVDTPLARLDMNTSDAYEEALRIFPDPRVTPQPGHS